MIGTDETYSLNIIVQGKHLDSRHCIIIFVKIKKAALTTLLSLACTLASVSVPLEAGQVEEAELVERERGAAGVEGAGGGRGAQLSLTKQ